MMALREFLLIFLALQSSRLLVNASQRVTCEKLESHHWEVDERNLQTCFIQHQKTNQLGATIGSPFEQNCTGLWFDGNKMSYLPINIGDKFPNLQAISAEECGLKAVGWEDFKDLTKLEILWLTRNSLEMIPGNTFRDCVNLQKVYLTENKIQFMGSNLFLSCPKISLLEFKGNKCADDDFHMHRDQLIDQMTRSCARVTDSMLENFVDEWKQVALVNARQLGECSLNTESRSTDVTLRRIHDNLEEVLSQQDKQQKTLESWKKDNNHQQQLEIQSLEAELKKSKIEIETLHKKIHTLEGKQ